MKKHLRITWNAPVVLSIVAVSFAATLLNYLTGGRSGLLLFMTYHSSLLSPMTWIRMFTHIFGHADWSHLIGNMSYLLLLGPMLEEKYSSRVLLEVILDDSVCDGTGKLYPFFRRPHCAVPVELCLPLYSYLRLQIFARVKYRLRSFWWQCCL